MALNINEKILPEPKRSQMKIQQTAFMLIAVILFFALVGMLLLVFRLSNLRESAALLEEKNAMLLVTKLANSPEFSCGAAFGSTRINCIDTDKLMALQQSISKYSGFWSVESIEIRKIYPKTNRKIVCNAENYPLCGIIKLVSGISGPGESVEGTSIANFVALCRKQGFEKEVYDKCELGKILVSYKTPG